MLNISNRVIQGDNLSVLKSIPDSSVQLVYVDPPFNTGRTQTRGTSVTTRSAEGNRIGFKGHRYEIVKETVLSYDDEFA
ncbi:MAG: site-specific DNA-methyltransferase, partial [Actinobacteria bacterium]|nr:site-specific DNA-methyltransferase [Actinomycetota bacterium]